MGVLNTLKYTNSYSIYSSEELIIIIIIITTYNDNLLIIKTNNPDMYRQAMIMQAAEVLEQMIFP